MRLVIYLVFICLLWSCSKTEEDIFTNIVPENIPIFLLSNSFTIHKNNIENISLNMGLWMFKEKKYEKKSIANWIDVQHEGKFILEPINVIWVDFKATSKNEAKQKILTYLETNKFIHRSGSSIGYFGYFGSSNWVSQFRETWSDKQNPSTINNHGRIFLNFETTTSNGQKVFITSGAFSIENEKHLFVSFDKALDAFNNTQTWQLYSENLNVHQILNDYTYTTFDHKRVKIFTTR